MKEIKLSDLKFTDWDNVSAGLKPISSSWGKTYFYYDKSSGKLFAENLTIIGRILRKCFGYKGEFNRTNLWEFLKDRKIVKDADLPAGNKFRSIAEKAFQETSATLEGIVSQPNSVDKARLQQLFDNKILDGHANFSGPVKMWQGQKYIINESPLFHAIEVGSTDVVIHLLDQGLDPLELRKMEFEEGATAPTEVPPVDNKLLEERPLDIAVKKQNEEIFKALILNTGRITQKHLDTLLSYALAAGDGKVTVNVNIVKTLLELGAKPTSMHLLIALGANFIIPNVGFRTSHFSDDQTQIAQEEIIVLLLEKGAVPSLECLSTTLEWRNSKTPAAVLSQCNIFKFLFNKLNPSKEQINKNYSLLFKALPTAPAEIVQFLLAKGADPNLKYFGKTVIKELLSETNSKDDNQRTKLKLLLQSNAPADSIDLLCFLERIYKIKPLEIEIVKLFLRNGISPSEATLQLGVKIACEDNNQSNLLSMLLDSLPSPGSPLLENLLFVAVEKFNIALVNFLLNKGANPRKELTPPTFARDDFPDDIPEMSWQLAMHHYRQFYPKTILDFAQTLLSEGRHTGRIEPIIALLQNNV